MNNIKEGSIIKIHNTDKIREICGDLGINFEEDLYVYEIFHGKEVKINKVKSDWHVRKISKDFKNYECELKGLGTQFIPSIYIEKVIN